MIRAHDPAQAPVTLRPLAGTEVSAEVSTEVSTGSAVLDDLESLEVGLWEHTAGTSTDIEVDEVFVVVSGRATVTAEDGTTIELAPGIVGVLEAGARTTWVVHEPLRKVYVVAR